MEFGVICISRQIAAGGEELGRAVAQRLGFQYVDEQIIEKAAAEAQVSPALIARTEHRQPLLKRIIEKIAASGAAGAPAAGSRRESNDLRLMIRAAIHDVAAAGRSVIVAHAASMALGATPGVLRVLVAASAATRIRRMAEGERLVEAEAERRVVASDRERAEYFPRFYGIQAELPTHYDVVINTDLLSLGQAADIIVAAAQPAATR